MVDGNIFWILASSSPYRRKILQQIGLPFRSVDARIAEQTMGIGEVPARRVQTLARAKAEAVVCLALEQGEACVLGMDTMVVHRGTMLGKPIDAVEAAKILSSLQGQRHDIVTGYACLYFKAGRLAASRVCQRVTTVVFRSLSSAWQAWYVRTGEWRGKAGGYALQGLGSTLIRRVEGDMGNGSGLSLDVLSDLCRSMGITLEPFNVLE